MYANLETIDPALARTLLEKNSLNRSMRKQTVGYYANDMRQGRWINNGQPIVISDTGELLDGQHRLQAIINAGVSVQMMVVRNVPREAFVTMDTGKARSAADVLSIRGSKNTNVLVGAAAVAWVYAAKARVTYTPSKMQLVEFVSSHPYLDDVVHRIMAGRYVLPRTGFAAVMFLANEERRYDHEVETFIEGILSGAGLFKGDPRLSVREWYLTSKKSNAGRMRAGAAFAAIVRAWNAHATGKPLLRIHIPEIISSDTMPIVGFNQALYPDVPDMQEKKAEVRRSNLSKRLATAPLRLPKAERKNILGEMDAA